MYCIINDDDDHWYVIPCDKKDEWNRIIENYDEALPPWAEPIDSASSISFAEFTRGCDA